jgi:hypothetical protein
MATQPEKLTSSSSRASALPPLYVRPSLGRYPLGRLRNKETIFR